MDSTRPFLIAALSTRANAAGWCEPVVLYNTAGLPTRSPMFQHKISEKPSLLTGQGMLCHIQLFKLSISRGCTDIEKKKKQPPKDTDKMKPCGSGSRGAVAGG